MKRSSFWKETAKLPTSSSATRSKTRMNSVFIVVCAFRVLQTSAKMRGSSFKKKSSKRPLSKENVCYFTTPNHIKTDTKLWCGTSGSKKKKSIHIG